MDLHATEEMHHYQLPSTEGRVFFFFFLPMCWANIKSNYIFSMPAASLTHSANSPNRLMPTLWIGCCHGSCPRTHPVINTVLEVDLHISKYSSQLILLFTPTKFSYAVWLSLDSSVVSAEGDV